MHMQNLIKFHWFIHNLTIIKAIWRIQSQRKCRFWSNSQCKCTFSSNSINLFSRYWVEMKPNHGIRDNLKTVYPTLSILRMLREGGKGGGGGFFFGGGRILCLCWGLMTRHPSTLVGHFVSSPTEREKRDRRDSRGVEREGQWRNEREETEEIKTFPSTLTCYNDSKPCPTVSRHQLDAPVT